MDTSVIVDIIKKNFEIFDFLARFLCWIAKEKCDEKIFCCKILGSLIKWDGENMKYVGDFTQKLVFATLLQKTNFWKNTLTYVIFSPSHFLGEPKILQQKFFFVTLYFSDSAQKFGQKIKNFKKFFDNIDNHTCGHMLIKNFFKLFCFLAKFFNFLKNG